MVKTAYKDYLITEDFRGDFHVSKDGHHITTQGSLPAAKMEVDTLVEWGFDAEVFNPQAVRGEHFV